jgi:hypothetical protein
MCSLKSRLDVKVLLLGYGKRPIELLRRHEESNHLSILLRELTLELLGQNPLVVASLSNSIM